MDWNVLGESDDGDFTISPYVRRQHLYVLGRTGTGKSTMLARLALSDITRGEGVLVLDPHGDLVDQIVAQCPPEHLQRLIYISPADRDNPIPLNMFECRDEDEKDTVCSQVVGIFKGLYGDSWGPQLEDLLRSLTLAMLDHQLLGRTDVIDEAHRFNATLKDAHDFVIDQRVRDQYYPYVGNDMVLKYWSDFYDNIGSGKGPVNHQQIKYASSTLNKVRRFLLNPLIFDIVCNRDRKNTINLRDAINERKIILVNLAKGKIGEDNSHLIGSVLLAQLAIAALSRADQSQEERNAAPFNVIVDEFQAFATSSLKLLLSEARKYAVTVTIAHQHREQLDYESKGATLNCGSILCFRLTGRDAEDMALELDSTPIDEGRVHYEPEMLRPGPSTTYYQSRTRQGGHQRYRRVVEPGSYGEMQRALANMLTQMPNFTAMARLSDGTNIALSVNALPETDPDEVRRRVKTAHEETAAKFGVPKKERASLRDPAFFTEVRRQQAVEVTYEADLEDAGGPAENPEPSSGPNTPA